MSVAGCRVGGTIEDHFASVLRLLAPVVTCECTQIHDHGAVRGELLDRLRVFPQWAVAFRMGHDGKFALAAQVEDSIDRQKAAARYEIAPDDEVSLDVLEELAGQRIQDPDLAARKATEMAPDEEEDDYTSRLLKAKKRLWEDKDN